MKIPKTTKDKPYIQFIFNEKGKIELSITSDWWGGENGGFVTSKGEEGNTCLPKDFDLYIKSFKEREIKEIEKEISKLQDRLDNLKQ